MRTALVITACVSILGAAHAAAPVDDIKAMVEAGRFPEALGKISASLHGAKGAMRYELYMLKGECHLQTKASSMASDAFDRALKDAPDLESRAIALAHVALIRKSPGLAYKVRTGEQKFQAIEIARPDARKHAFAALLTDETTLNKVKLRAAEGAKTLPPILDIVDDVVILLGIEIAGKGKADEMQEMLKAILARGRDLITDTLKELDRTVTRIGKQANTYREFQQEQMDRNFRMRRVTVWQKQGLTRNEMADLQAIGKTCDRIAPAVEVLAQGAKSEQKDFEALVDQAMRIRKQITQILDEDYTVIHQTRPK